MAVVLQSFNDVDGEDGQSQPDAGETDNVGCREAFLVDKDAYEKLARRRDVLQETQRGEGNAFGGFAVEQQRYRCDCACQQQQQPGEPLEVVERRLAVGAEPGDVYHRRRHHPDGFNGQRRCGVETHLLFQKTVDAETEGQPQRDDGEVAVVDGEIEHSRQRQQQRRRLCTVEALVKEQIAQQHVDQRVDVVSQAALQYVAVVYGPDVESPVEADERAGDEQHQVLTGALDVLFETHLAYAAEKGDHKPSRPQHSVRQYLETVNLLKQPPI